MNDDRFGVVVRFSLHTGAAEAFDRLVDETIGLIQAEEPGTLVYVCHTVQDQPDQRVFYELYQDRDAFEAHEAQPHVKRFLAEREQHLAGLTVDFVTPVAAKGLPNQATA